MSVADGKRIQPVTPQPPSEHYDSELPGALSNFRQPAKNPMTQQEHLNRIRARCVELLEIAERRTAGLWDATTCSLWSANECLCEDASEDNLRFFAACAGTAEAGWKATIAAIDTLKPISESEMCADAAHACDHPIEASEAINSIIASWPIELL